MNYPAASSGELYPKRLNGGGLIMQEKIIEAMCRSDFYPDRPKTVKLIKTHISLVFIADDFVYKVKKTVSFGFLDFSTLAKRKFYCEEELRLNRRLAADFYLDVAVIYEDAKGNLTLTPNNNIVEYAVLMKKLPEDKMLKSLLAKGRASDKIFEDLGKKIAYFHAQAETSKHISQMGLPENISRNHEENFSEMAGYVNVTIPADQYEFIKNYDESFITRKQGLLKKRVAHGKIRECHGDLHLEHICITENIAIFDCIEFNERFRCMDTAAEVAFLAMDMDLNGYHEKRAIFINSYIRHSGDSDVLSLLDFYRCYYAFVRGKVTSLRLAQREEVVAERLDIMEGSEKYFNLAYCYAARLDRPVLLITAGLTGTGKSYLARELSLMINAEVIRTDVLRKELLNMDSTQRQLDDFGKGIYSDDMTGRTYDNAFDIAAALIKNNKAVIIDASFKRRADRDRAVALATSLGVDYYVIECTCPEEIVKERLSKRMHEGTDASDGRWEIYVRQKLDFEEINEIPTEHYLRLEGSLDFKTHLNEIVKKISPS